MGKSAKLYYAGQNGPTQARMGAYRPSSSLFNLWMSSPPSRGQTKGLDSIPDWSRGLRHSTICCLLMAVRNLLTYQISKDLNHLLNVH